mmetsp:Transcript_22958/g.77050  ORF Transcript_22958/g.77050 Transcript_22958/m.77050 type:complete len:297 (+) Transcript_22958:318-1208(+)
MHGPSRRRTMQRPRARVASATPSEGHHAGGAAAAAPRRLRTAAGLRRQPPSRRLPSPLRPTNRARRARPSPGARRSVRSVNRLPAVVRAGPPVLVCAVEDVRGALERAHNQQVLVHVGDHEGALVLEGRLEGELEAELRALDLLVGLHHNAARLGLQGGEELEGVLHGEEPHAEGGLHTGLLPADGERRVAQVHEGHPLRRARRGAGREHKGLQGCDPWGGCPRVEHLPLAVDERGGGRGRRGVELLQLQHELRDELAVQGRRVARAAAERRRATAELGDEGLLGELPLVEGRREG